MIAAVRGVIAASIADGSMFCVEASTSANTGVRPAWMIALTDAQKVIGVVFVIFLVGLVWQLMRLHKARGMHPAEGAA